MNTLLIGRGTSWCIGGLNCPEFFRNLFYCGLIPVSLFRKENIEYYEELTSEMMNIEQITQQLNQSGIKKSEPVLVAFSGGADSLCLLHLLLKSGFNVTAAHFDHHLREESTSEAERVKGMAAVLGVEFLSGSADVKQFAVEQKFSIEEAARECRYHYLFKTAQKIGAKYLAVGHHADDQVETVLMHLIRGSGLSGLRGMEYKSVNRHWQSNIPIIRPLLAYWRSDIEHYCADYKLNPVMDASNSEAIYQRNQMRLEVIPYLEKLNPQFKRSIWKLSRNVQFDHTIIQEKVEEAWDRCLQEENFGKGWISFSFKEVLETIEGIQRYLIRKALTQLTKDPKNIDFDCVERAVDFVNFPVRSKEINLVQGIWLSLHGESLVFSVGEPGNWEDHKDQPFLISDEILDLPLSGEVELNQYWKIKSKEFTRKDLIKDLEKLDGTHEVWINADLIPGAIQIRARKPGDRFHPFGMEGKSMKLKDFMINEKLPRRRRDTWPLVCFDDQIAWVVSYRLSNSYRITDQTQKVIRLSLERIGEFD
ncbi:MAG: tRNA lysidine(34) synthetase TilS [Anaerolineaceae bacterium]|nr:tRNA lysidine(34) synthetase TilS [Anaerolineaceae bacterium]